MTPLSRKTLLGTVALAAVLSAPLALAQSATATTPVAEEAAAAATTAPANEAASSAPAATGTEPGAATSEAAPARKTWAELDTNKDGNLSKDEAGAMESLAAVFEKADVDANGSLTGAEYKAYVAATNGGAGKQAGDASKK